MATFVVNDRYTSPAIFVRYELPEASSTHYFSPLTVEPPSSDYDYGGFEACKAGVVVAWVRRAAFDELASRELAVIRALRNCPAEEVERMARGEQPCKEHWVEVAQALVSLRQLYEAE